MKDLTQHEHAEIHASAAGLVLKGRASNAEVLAELRTFLPARVAAAS